MLVTIVEWALCLSSLEVIRMLTFDQVFNLTQFCPLLTHSQAYCTCVIRLSLPLSLGEHVLLVLS